MTNKTPNTEPQPMTGFGRLVAVETLVNRRSLSAAAKTKTKENLMKSILPSLLTGSLLLSAAMAGETGPAPLAPDGTFGLPGSEWPRWGGRNDCNAVSVATNLPTVLGDFTQDLPEVPGSLSADSHVRWKYPSAPDQLVPNYTSPVVARGKVLVAVAPRTGRSVSLACLRESNGELVWLCPLPNGLYSAPVVEENAVYLRLSSGELYCLDLEGQANGNDGAFQDEMRLLRGKSQVQGVANCDILWVYDFRKKLSIQIHDAISSAPLVQGSQVFCVTGDCISQERRNATTNTVPAVAVLDKTTGVLLATDNGSIPVYHSVWSSPSHGRVNGKDLFFFAGDNGVVYAFPSAPQNGQNARPGLLNPVWWCDLNAPERRKAMNAEQERMALRTDKPMSGSTILHPEFLHAPSGPRECWATPVFHENKVYVALTTEIPPKKDVGALVCVDATGAGDITKTGKVWINRDLGMCEATAVVANGLIFIHDRVANFCLDARTGVTLWSAPRVNPQRSRDHYASPLVADGKVFVGSAKGLEVFAATAQKRLLAFWSIGAVNTTPAPVNGTLFVIGDNCLYAVEKRTDTKHEKNPAGLDPLRKTPPAQN